LVGTLEKVTGNYIGITQILSGKIAIDDLGAVAQPPNGDQRLTPQVAQGIKLDTHSRDAIAPGRGGDRPAVTATQIIDHIVGYNSPAQFSREYKRHFGFLPSAT
jgi:AraC-like DNA-binding protein